MTVQLRHWETKIEQNPFTVSIAYSELTAVAWEFWFYMNSPKPGIEAIQPRPKFSIGQKVKVCLPINDGSFGLVANISRVSWYEITKEHVYRLTPEHSPEISHPYSEYRLAAFEARLERVETVVLTTEQSMPVMPDHKMWPRSNRTHEQGPLGDC